MTTIIEFITAHGGWEPLVTIILSIAFIAFTIVAIVHDERQKP